MIGASRDAHARDWSHDDPGADDRQGEREPLLRVEVERAEGTDQLNGQKVGGEEMRVSSEDAERVIAGPGANAARAYLAQQAGHQELRPAVGVLQLKIVDQEIFGAEPEETFRAERVRKRQLMAVR